MFVPPRRFERTRSSRLTCRREGVEGEATRREGEGRVRTDEV
jgi:hypothetical protein